MQFALHKTLIKVWEENASADLQRLVILQALPFIQSSQESENLQFMLKALQSPEQELEECARLARGNSLEKAIAAKRISLLEANTRLRLIARR